MRSFFFKLLIIVIPIGLTITLVNYLVDPANIFSGTDYIGGIANILARGHNVDNVTNYDERLLQEQMIKKLQKAPDVVVLGSSRVMEINSGFFPGKKVLNCGVSHGNTDDLFSILGALDSLNKLPGEVVIGLDPMFLFHGGSSEWQSLYPYHEYLVTKLFGANLHPDEQQPSPFRKVSSLYALDYFQSSLQFMLAGKSKRYVDVGLNTPKTTGRFSDGSISYSQTYTHPDHAKVATDARVTGENGMPMPDSLNIELFGKLLTFLKEKEISIHLAMIPYHPEYYKALKQYHKQAIEKVESTFRDIAAQYHLPLSGSFCADSVGMPETDFYDTYHCSGEAIKKYIPIR